MLMQSLPNSWKSLPLIDVATLQRGFDLPVQNRVPGEVPILAASAIVGTHADAKVKGPGVVTGRSGSIGGVQYVTEDYWPLNTTLYVKNFHGNYPRFIYYLLRELRLERYHEGTGVPTLNRNNIHGIEVAVPSIAEQRRIAAILDEADAVRAKRKEALKHLETLPQSIFTETFGCPIENRKRYPVSKLIEIIDSGRPITYGILMPGPDVAQGVPYVRVVDMKNGGIDTKTVRCTTKEISEGYKRSILTTGDLLLSIRGHVGRLAVVPAELERANITQDTARLAVSGAHGTYVLECLRAVGFQRWMARHTKGIAVRGINLGDVKNMPIPIPPRHEQELFAKRMREIDSLLVQHRNALTAHDALYASLQHRAFRGEL